jgi:hypothetical protein
MMVLFIGTGFGKDTPDLTKNSTDTEQVFDLFIVNVSEQKTVDFKSITEQFSPSYWDIQKSTGYINYTFTSMIPENIKAAINYKHYNALFLNRNSWCKSYNNSNTPKA